MTTWLTAIIGATLIGVAVHGLAERSRHVSEDNDGLNRQQRQRAAALAAAREVTKDAAVDAGDLIDLAAYICDGTRGLPTPEAS